MGLQGDECSNPASQQGQTLPALFGWLLTEGYGYIPSARKGIPLSKSTLWRLLGCGGVVSLVLLFTNRQGCAKTDAAARVRGRPARMHEQTRPSMSGTAPMPSTSQSTRVAVVVFVPRIQ